MIVTFQSKASGDVIMFGDVAHHMMRLMDKAVTPQGIITAEQLPDAIARLKAAVTKDREEHQRIANEEQETWEANTPRHEAAPQTAISLTQRTLPLIELLERSMQKSVPVTWGV